MDSYFATVEQQSNPNLQGRPVGIIKALGRGCVIAASIEAKKFGVKTGVSVWEAKSRCPGIRFVPADMDKYFSLTKKLIEIMGHYSFNIEVFSIDEVFVEVSDTWTLFSGGIVEMVYRMKNEIREKLGSWVKCSVGVSFNKLAAKLASEMNKPNGLTFLTAENYLRETEDVNVGDVCGIGHARTEYLYGRGLFTLGKAREVDLPEEVRRLVWLEDDTNLITNEDIPSAKSVSRTYTTYRELGNEREIGRLVRNLTEETAVKLREMGMRGRTFGLNLSSNSGERKLRIRKTLELPLADPLIIFDLLWREYRKTPLPWVRFAGVWVSNLISTHQQLLANELQKRETVLNSVDAVNARWGLFTVYPAVLLGGELIRPEVTGFLGDKSYRFGLSVGR